MNYEIKELNEKAEAYSEEIKKILKEIKKVIVGHEKILEKLLISLVANGHVLLEGAPGLAKTLMIKTLSETLHANFRRIQFTPDILPADIIGTKIYNHKDSSFSTKKGPIFANFILADEINRAPPKVQSALLEAMQERQVTIQGDTFEIKKPFLVLATQNPIEQEGTYPLPEAQLDRFMFNLILDYPRFDEELDIVTRTTGGINNSVSKIVSAEEIIFFQQLLRKIPVADNVLEYAVKLVSKTRPGTTDAHDWTNKFLNWGAGPRASQFLIIGAKVNAALSGKYSPDIEDVKAIALPVLRHRIIRNYKAEAEGITTDNIIEELMK